MAANQELVALGRTVAEMEDEALAERDRPSTNARLAAIHATRARKAAARERRSLWRPIAVGLVAAAAVLVMVFRQAPLHFAVGASKVSAEIGDWVAAPPEETTPIEFSDGTHVVLKAGARARVVGIGENGARILIERGTLRADVVPRRGNDWSIMGGPFEIHVTGTSFDASWDPESEVLHVAMYEGHVLIRGACLEGARALSKGESVALSCRKEPIAAAPSPADSSIPPKVPSANVSGTAASGTTVSGATPSVQLRVPAEQPPAASGAPENTAAPSPSWRESARAGHYKEALAAAEVEGFGSLCEKLSAGDLFELATTARLAGKTARATEAYTALRAHFGGSDTAAMAAFHLGQMAFDGAHAYPEAHRWFTTYLAERPSGALAAEALGRTMEAEQRMGDLGSARRTATHYLERYPAGAHVPLAKSLLNP